MKNAASQSASSRRMIRWAAIILLVYSAIETVDCLALIGMQTGLIANLYPPFIFKEIEQVMNGRPLLMLPAFLFFMLFHLWAGVGLWKNRLWGWWMAVFITAAVVVFSPILLPVSGADLLVTIPLAGLLFIGYFGQKTLNEGVS